MVSPGSLGFPGNAAAMTRTPPGREPSPDPASTLPPYPWGVNRPRPDPRPAARLTRRADLG